MTSTCFIPTPVSGETLMQICINGTSVSMTPYDGTDPSVDALGAVQSNVDSFISDVDTFYLLFAGCLVFFMQCGFSMLEAGCVSAKNTQNILYKNLMDACLGAFFFWGIGYGFAYGTEEGTLNHFIGIGNFFLYDADVDYIGFFFQWAFAATAATIVSGSVAERCSLPAYFTYSTFLTMFIYPVVVHWVWSTEGWLSAFVDDSNVTKFFTNNMMDFAGSGVVHMVGGFSGLMGAIALGPRSGRFEPGGEEKYRPHSVLNAALGVAILWFGWYGFNCGSTLGINGYGAIAAKVAVTTTLAAAFGAITCTVYARVVPKEKHWDLLLSLNGVLAGLVSITAPCCLVEPWAAAVIGIIGGIIYIASSNLLKYLKIDDPLDACPIHGFCGLWGVISVGIFTTDENIAWAYGGDASYSTGEQLGVQILGGLAILLWTLGTSGILFFTLKALKVLRVSEDVEEAGLDNSEHGGKAYNFATEKDAAAATPMIRVGSSKQQDSLQGATD